jgi:hypothetical protein
VPQVLSHGGAIMQVLVDFLIAMKIGIDGISCEFRTFMEFPEIRNTGIQKFHILTE